jgi:hypothetical protein
MSGTNRPYNSPEDWTSSSPWAGVPPQKPSGILQQELEPLNEDPMLEPDAASHKAYAQGDTIGSAYLPRYLLAVTKIAYAKLGLPC